MPDEIVQNRQGITASATTDPNSVCYTCHKVLTPLAYQRAHWDDEGNYRAHDERGLPIDQTDRDEVANYPFKGEGMEAYEKRRDFVKKLAYVTPAVLTLLASPSSARAGSGQDGLRTPRDRPPEPAPGR